ncbi:hypothetical protein HDU86_002706, partial [Geranomyces michiganensis]
RPGLQRLVVKCIKGLVKEVVVAHRDRLARFGIDLLELIFDTCRVKLVVDAQDGSDASASHGTQDGPQQLAEDLMAIVHVFSCRDEAKECLAYSNAKAIATWYINKRKEDGENRDLMDLAQTDAWEMKRLEDERAKALEEAQSANAPENASKEDPEQASTQEKANKATRAKEKVSKSMRAMAFRLYPSEALAEGLCKWIDIANAIDAHVKDNLEAFAADGEKASFRYLCDDYICLTAAKLRKMEQEGTLDQLRDLERRRAYVSLPFDVQQAVIKESVANVTASQTNYEKGNNQ